MAQLLGPAAHSLIWSLSFLNCLHCLPLQRLPNILPVDTTYSSFPSHNTPKKHGHQRRERTIAI